MKGYAFYQLEIRNMLRLIDGLPAFNIVGIILIITSTKEQRFGDHRANTYVIKNGKY